MSNDAQNMPVKNSLMIAVKEEEVDAKNTDAENEPVLDDANMMLLVD